MSYRLYLKDTTTQDTFPFFYRMEGEKIKLEKGLKFISSLEGKAGVVRTLPRFTKSLQEGSRATSGQRLPTLSAYASAPRAATR